MAGVKRERKTVKLNDALIGFREISRLRGPSLKEFAEAFNMAGISSAQSVFRRLEANGWITTVEGGSIWGTKVAYIFTPSGERRYRELIPDPKDWMGPTWPVD